MRLQNRSVNQTQSETINQKDFTKSYWEGVWKSVKLPQVRHPAKYHELHALFLKHLPPGGGGVSLLEIGCAPGSWMSYFFKNFGYTVAGIEYAEVAYKKTVENLNLLSVPAKVYLADFFTFKESFDIIFSSGFIEHFEDVEERVIKPLVSLCKVGGYVVTIIPGMEGPNWAISRYFRPEVAAGHYPITRTQLRLIHERQGLKTLWNEAYGCLQLRLPFDNTRLASARPWLSKMLNVPFKTWNRVVSLLTRTFRYYPHISPFFIGTVYIGRKLK